MGNVRSLQGLLLALLLQPAAGFADPDFRSALPAPLSDQDFCDNGRRLEEKSRSRRLMATLAPSIR